MSSDKIVPKNIDIDITGEDVTAILSWLEQRPSDLFVLDVARYVVAKRRYEDAMSRGGLQVSDDDRDVWANSIENAKDGLSDFRSASRTSRLIRPMSAIDKVFFGAANLKVLSVGPRTEMELLSLVGQGFRPENIRGLDLLSYSPWVDTGNAHNMPYPDASFDVIVLGWVLVYSSDPMQVCKEILRVARDGAVIAIGSTYWPEDKRLRESPDRTARHYPLVEDILDMFEGSVKTVYVRHNPPDLSKEGRTIVLFDVQK